MQSEEFFDQSHVTAAFSVSPLADMTALNEDHRSSAAGSNATDDDSEANEEEDDRGDIELRQKVQSLFFLLLARCWPNAQIHEALFKLSGS